MIAITVFIRSVASAFAGWYWFRMWILILGNQVSRWVVTRSSSLIQIFFYAIKNSINAVYINYQVCILFYFLLWNKPVPYGWIGWNDTSKEGGDVYTVQLISVFITVVLAHYTKNFVVTKQVCYKFPVEGTKEEGVSFLICMSTGQVVLALAEPWGWHGSTWIICLLNLGSIYIVGLVHLRAGPWYTHWSFNVKTTDDCIRRHDKPASWGLSWPRTGYLPFHFSCHLSCTLYWWSWL